jgi:hypothetical protein
MIYFAINLIDRKKHAIFIVDILVFLRVQSIMKLDAFNFSYESHELHGL